MHRLEPLSQGGQHATQSSTVIEQCLHGGGGHELQPLAQQQLRLDFGQRTSGNDEEPLIVTTGSRMTLGDVGSNGNTGAPKLGDEPVTLGHGKPVRRSMDPPAPSFPLSTSAISTPS